MTNIIGHGHVIPRDDGYKAECGGPALCSVCKAEMQSNFAGYANTPVGQVAVHIGPSEWKPKLYTQADLDAAIAKELECCLRAVEQSSSCFTRDEQVIKNLAVKAIRARTTP